MLKDFLGNRIFMILFCVTPCRSSYRMYYGLFASKFSRLIVLFPLCMVSTCIFYIFLLYSLIHIYICALDINICSYNHKTKPPYFWKLRYGRGVFFSYFWSLRGDLTKWDHTLRDKNVSFLKFLTKLVCVVAKQEKKNFTNKN